MIVRGQIIDVLKRRIFKGGILVKEGRIADIWEEDGVPNVYIMPGFIDSHIHIESSHLVPSEFAKVAISSGCVACLCDPHEIANVMGIDGVEFMIENGKKVDFKFYFGAPSCVPSSELEKSGARIGIEDVENLLRREEVKFLSEVMDVEGVLKKREEILRKIAIAKFFGKPIDGHAPLLSGKKLEDYIASGISTDHEIEGIDEAREKIEKGMKIIIRYGSLSKNLDTLLPLISEHPKKCMLGSDDKVPNELLDDYLNVAVRKAKRKGASIFDLLYVTSVIPVFHYKIDVGLLRVGDPADFIVVDDLENLTVLSTYICGKEVYSCGKVALCECEIPKINNFKAKKLKLDEIEVRKRGESVRVIGVKEGSLVTKSLVEYPKTEGHFVVADTQRDILKVVLVDRYKEEKSVVVGFVKGFGLKKGAIASSVSHDSHNLIGVGCDDNSLVEALNAIIEHDGGLSFYSQDKKLVLPLSVAGLMSDKGYNVVASTYEKLNKYVRDCGCTISHPYMALSFLSLGVIPELKITSFGLFDVLEQRFVDLFV